MLSDETVVAGNVISQSLVPLAEVAENSEVVLTVSAGPLPADIPIFVENHSFEFDNVPNGGIINFPTGWSTTASTIWNNGSKYRLIQYYNFCNT